MDRGASVMPFQPLVARRLYRDIADQIRGLLASGAFPPGSRLPPERDMAAQLHVSRTSVREALIALEVRGLVEVRGGSGIYVAWAPMAAAVPFPGPIESDPSPRELLEARRLVEGEAAAQAAVTINAGDLARMTGMVERLQVGDLPPDEEENLDRQFHLGIAEATGNSVLVQTITSYWELRRGPAWQTLLKQFDSPEMRAVVAADHRHILQALQDHSAEGARTAMHEHLRRAKHGDSVQSA
jgi:GntR family uxuAB operon transcriptional repressor